VAVDGITPILNVSDLQASFEWFEKLGWAKSWDWCPPESSSPTFGAVVAGDHEIFLCLDDQGGRGEHGMWVAIWFDHVDDVGVVQAACEKGGIEVISAPEDKPWNVREMHIRHPDGHVFRISAGLEHEHDHDHEHDDHEH
jgi:predicted enzyme related to lactoylglutathione lyase